MKNKDALITLAHGSGGSRMQSLISDTILKYLSSPELDVLDDAAELKIDSDRLAFSTDTFTVKPIFFPGGDIGSLAVSGTVNDVLMKGARPLCLSLGMVIEEGFPMPDFERILKSIQQACTEAGVRIVTGDTKVVGKGEMDGVFINTSGIGQILPELNLACTSARVGDAVIVSGDIGAHGVAVMTERNGLHLTGEIKSDAAPLTGTIIPLLEKYGNAFHVLRDPTRGGVATTLNEIANSSRVGIILDEADIPVSEAVNAVCDLLGFDPLYLPCEGRFLAFVDQKEKDNIITYLNGEGNCPNAKIIGKVVDASTPEVQLKTFTGGYRYLDVPAGEMLPRIC